MNIRLILQSAVFGMMLGGGVVYGSQGSLHPVEAVPRKESDPLFLSVYYVGYNFKFNKFMPTARNYVVDNQGNEMRDCGGLEDVNSLLSFFQQNEQLQKSLYEHEDSPGETFIMINGGVVSFFTIENDQDELLKKGCVNAQVLKKGVSDQKIFMCKLQKPLYTNNVIKAFDRTSFVKKFSLIGAAALVVLLLYHKANDIVGHIHYWSSVQLGLMHLK